MELVLYIGAFMTMALFVLLVYQAVFVKHQLIAEKLLIIQQMSPQQSEDEELKKPFVERLLKPVYQRFLNIISNLTPVALKNKYTELIVSAGLPDTVTFNRVLAIQLLLAALLVFFLFSMIPNESNHRFLLIFIGAGIGFILPISTIRTNGNRRKEQIIRALPDMLDLLHVSVEAGLSFDSALKQAAEKMRGPLGTEFLKALEEINKGRNRADALRGVTQRTQEPDLTSFVTAVIQTEQLGSNIANMLRIQSQSMRQKRTQRAEEKARKVPVTMLIPIIFLIFPALFIVLLGPAMLSIMDAFK